MTLNFEQPYTEWPYFFEASLTFQRNPTLIASIVKLHMYIT